MLGTLLINNLLVIPVNSKHFKVLTTISLFSHTLIVTYLHNEDVTKSRLMWPHVTSMSIARGRGAAAVPTGPPLITSTHVLTEACTPKGVVFRVLFSSLLPSLRVCIFIWWILKQNRGSFKDGKTPNYNEKKKSMWVTCELQTGFGIG